jgi:sulfite reductase alpha subunit-like flavoprotein
MTLDRPVSVPLIPENAPFSSAQRAWLNGFLAGLFSQANVDDRSVTPRKRVAIYYGSETGNAEAFAKRAAKALVQRGFESKAICLDKANLGSLASEEFALFVTSTYGDGDPPANAKAFHAELMQPPPDFHSVIYSMRYWPWAIPITNTSASAERISINSSVSSAPSVYSNELIATWILKKPLRVGWTEC